MKRTKTSDRLKALNRLRLRDIEFLERKIEFHRERLAYWKKIQRRVDHWNIRYQLFTKLQDTGWEFYKEGDLEDLKKEIKRMRKGPLGTSCMYQIVNECQRVVFTK